MKQRYFIKLSVKYPRMNLERYETGMRVGELSKNSKLHLPEPFKKIGNIYIVDRGTLDDKDRQSKTGEQTVPVSTSLLEKIDDYVMYHRP